MTAAALITQVIDLLRRSALPAGAHIREQWLADSLTVSRSPVRRTLAELEGYGLLTRQPNRGYFLTRPSGDLRLPDRTGGDPAEKAYFEIGEDFLKQRFDGEFTTVEISRQYNLTTPQANRVLARLEAEDLIRRRQGRGWEFRRLLSSTEAHEESFRFRMILEPAALLEPSFSLSREMIDEHRAQQQSLLEGNVLLLPGDEIFRINIGFHEMLMEASGNPFVVDSLARVNRVRRFMEYRHYGHRDQVLQEAREHLRLLDLIEGGELTTASRLLRNHLDSMRRRKTTGATE
ncbi:GntR family transcriptional regulator [Nocardia rhamnosiphila]